MRLVIAFIIIVLISVIAHEGGHLLASKHYGVPVEAFNIGMGPKLFSMKKGGIEWCIKLLPLGGSCFISTDVFETKKPIEKTIIFAAGILVNLMISFIFMALFLVLDGSFSIWRTVSETLSLIVSVIPSIPSSVVSSMSGQASNIGQLGSEMVNLSNSIDTATFWKIVCIVGSSINAILGILNILPIPGLDGGQIAMTLPEFWDRKIPERVAEPITKGCMFIILLFSILVLIKDLVLL